MSNAVVYARYSSHSQTEQSIEGQLAAAHKYADDHNLNIIHEYCDRAKTGTNDNREQFQLMLHDCAKKQFDTIIVWKVDRFGRNREEIAFNKHHCKKYGVKVEYVAENISEGPEGVILEAVLEGMAEYYSLQLSQNIKRGKLESAKKHRVVTSSVPLGYRNDGGSYAIDPDEAEIVLRAFQLFSTGLSMAEVTRQLNDAGYRTRRGNLFTKNSLPRMLHNEIYIGTYKYKDQICEENVIPAIVPRDLWLKCQPEGPKRPPVSHVKADYLLSGKLVCEACGTPMKGSSGYSKHHIKYNYYKCPKCGKTHPQKEAEEKIKGAVKTAILSDKGIDKIADLVYSYYLRTAMNTNSGERLENELNVVNKGITNITKAIESGLDYSIVKNRLEDLLSKQKDLDEQIRRLNLSRPPKLTREHIVLYLRQFRNISSTEGDGNLGSEYNKDRVVEKRMLNTFLNSALISEECSIVSLNYSETTEFSNVFYCLNGVRPEWREWSCANGIRTLDTCENNVSGDGSASSITVLNGALLVKIRYF